MLEATPLFLALCKPVHVNMKVHVQIRGGGNQTQSFVQMAYQYDDLDENERGKVWRPLLIRRDLERGDCGQVETAEERLNQIDFKLDKGEAFKPQFFPPVGITWLFLSRRYFTMIRLD